MLPGQLVAGRFEIERYAGAGGMGTVYRAKDRDTGRPVALKILHPEGAPDGERFAREAQALAGLSHPGFVRLIAHGEAEDRTPYLALEWLEGESLADRLARSSVSLAEAMALGLRVAEALGEAHARGIVHRDIKPANLILPMGRIEDARILDFGIAYLEGAEQPEPEAGAPVGTPGYMAPEQARGEQQVSARADVFSLGCVIFKCLTGRRPFEADDMTALLARLVLDDPPRLASLRPDAPPDLDQLLSRMLAKSPADRPADGAEVARSLAAIGGAAGDPPAASRAPLSLTTTERPMICVVLARIDAESAAAGHTALREAIKLHGGQLAVLADRSILVTVPGRGVFVDQAARAARCAIATRACYPRARIAAVAGRGEVTAPVPMGAVIDRGVDLLRAAPSGVVRIDEVIAGLVAGAFDVGGDSAGLTLLGERKADGARTLLGKAIQFVGRERELGLLADVAEEVATERVARVVVVSAGAGIGKSRLRMEFLRRMREGAGPAFEAWIGRGDPMRAGSPFGLIAGMIREIAGVIEGEPVEVRRHKLKARLGRSVRPADAPRVAMFLGELAGAPFPDEESVELASARRDAMLMGDEKRRAFADFVAAEVESGPRMLVIEDLQACDRASILFIDDLLRALHDRPLMVLALGRPAITDRFPALFTERVVTWVRLPHLAKKASARLVQQALGPAVTPATLARIVALADGDAFYLEELIRAVAEGKGDELPETVLAMVQERLDGLDPEQRRALRAASVFGRVFWAGGVEALIGGAGAASVASALADLAARELIQHEPVTQLSDQDQFVFRQGLLREAAYAMLTDADRRLGHRLAAAWLERAGETEAGLLGDHFERGGEPARAVAWYRRAAASALEGGDLGEAIRWADQAIRCAGLPDGADASMREAIGTTRRIQAEALRLRSDFVLAERHALEALMILPEATEPWFLAIAEVANLSGRLGRTARLVEIGAQLRELWTPDAGPSQVNAMAQAATYLIHRGVYGLADELLAGITEVEQRTRDPREKGRIYLAVAMRALVHGDPGRHLALTAAAADRFAEAGDRRSACMARITLGFSYTDLGSYAEAEQHLREALAVGEQMGLPTVAAYARHVLGLTLYRLGALEEARAIEGEAADRFTAQGDARLAGGSRAYLAMILAAIGDLDAAEREATAAIEVLGGAPPVRAYALATRARIRISQGRSDLALGDARKAAKLLGDLGGIEEGEALVRLTYAEALRAQEDLVGARAAIAEARSRLLRRSAEIAEPRLRELFLSKVPENARTLELAVAWGAR